jgi:hypothetical protein
MNHIIYIIPCCCSLLVRRLHSSSSCSQTAAELLISGRWVVFEASAFDRLLTAEVCCFVLLTRGWGRLETRPPVALGGAVAFALYLPSARCCALIGMRGFKGTRRRLLSLSHSLSISLSASLPRLLSLSFSLSLTFSLSLSLSLSRSLSMFLCHTPCLVGVLLVLPCWVFM